MRSLNLFVILLFFVSCFVAQPAQATTIVNITDGTGQISIPGDSRFTLSAPGVEASFSYGPAFTNLFTAQDCLPRCFSRVNGLFDGGTVTLANGKSYTYSIDCLLCFDGTVITTPGLDFATLSFADQPTRYTLPLHFETDVHLKDHPFSTAGPGAYQFIADGLWTIDVRHLEGTNAGLTYGQVALTFDQNPVVTNPEPATWLLMLSGVVGLLLYQYRRVRLTA